MGLLNNYKNPKKHHQHDKWGVQEELAFFQNGEEEKKANAMEGTKFHVCNNEGHWGYECPTLLPAEQAQRKKEREERWASAKKKSGKQYTQVGEVIDADWRNCDGVAGDVENGFSMLAAGKKKSSETMQTYPPNKKKSDYCLPKDCRYLDSCSTYISFFNPDLLEDIRQVSTMLLGHTNAGTSNTNWVGNFGDLETWLDTNVIANIFGISALKKEGSHITHDSDDGFYIVTNKTTGVSVKFQE